MSKNEMRSSGERRSAVHDNADPWDSVCRCGFRVCGCHCAGADFWRMDRRRSIRHLRDAVQRSRLCCAVQSLFRVHEERTHLLRRGLFNIQDDNLLRECWL